MDDGECLKMAKNSNFLILCIAAGEITSLTFKVQIVNINITN